MACAFDLFGQLAGGATALDPQGAGYDKGIF
jgi:hypothetical protein